MNIRECLCRLFVTAIAAGGLMLSASAANFTAGSKINVLRPFDKTVTQQSSAEWTDYFGYRERTGAYAIDGGINWAQVTGEMDFPANHGCLDITLPAEVSISSIYTSYGGHLPARYRLLGSTTGFDSMTELVSYKPAAGDEVTDTFAPTNIKYLRYQFDGTLSTKYVVMREIQAYASDPTKIRRGAGYNLLAEPSIGGVPNDPLYRSSGWLDDTNAAVDQNVNNYLRGGGSGTIWFVQPLGDSYKLTGGAFAFYPDQAWGGGITIDVTNDETISESTVWTRAYTPAGSMSGWGSMPFTQALDARFIRVSTDGAGAGGALSELEFFTPVAVPGDANNDSKVDFADYLILESSYGSAPGGSDSDADFDDNGVVEFADYLVLEANFGTGAVPEPATLALLSIAGLALARRRR